MPTVFQTFDKNGRPHKKWRFKYVDYEGKRRTATGHPTKEETKTLAWKTETEQKLIRDGMRPRPKSCDQPRTFEAVVAEYLAWGESQGGHGGRPWAKGHLVMRRRHLKFWRNRLALDFLSDLIGSLPKVEAALREKQNAGRAGKTLQNYAEALAALCDWAIDREYLESDPLKKLQKFDVSPRTFRRALTAEEVNRVLAAAPLDRRILFEVALASGLRAGELRSLRVSHLDAVAGGLRLEAAWTKGRKAVFQPLHPALVQKLAAYSSSKATSAPLLKVPKATSKLLYKYLALAGIPKVTAEGHVDFHALRTAYTTFVFEAGASVKEAQSLARHSTPDLTVNVYAKSRSPRLSEIAGAVGDMFLTAPPPCPTSVQQPPATNPATVATAVSASSSNAETVTPGTGSNPDRQMNSGVAVVGQPHPQLGQEQSQVGPPIHVVQSSMVESRKAPDTAADDFGQRGCTIEVQRLILAASGLYGFHASPAILPIGYSMFSAAA